MARQNEEKFINNLREKEMWCNAKITSSDGRTIAVHSAVMMTQSQFFRAVFQFGPNDGKKGAERARVFVPCVDGETLDAVVRFVYTGEAVIDKTNVWNFIRAADFLQMPLLLQKSLGFLKENMSFSTCAKLLQYTERKVFLPNVRKIAIDFALQNFCEPAFPMDLRQTTIQNLSIDSLEGLLKNDYLNAPREEIVWDTIVDYIEKNPNVEYLVRLINTMRFGFVPSPYVVETILSHPLVKENHELTILVKNIEQELQDWMLTENPVEKTPQSIQSRVPHACILAVGGWVGPSPSHEILVYNPLTDAWTRAESLECPQKSKFSYHGLVNIGDWLYLVGGTEMYDQAGSEDTSRCMRVNISTFEWQKISDLHVSRNFLGCVELDGLIYAFGGRGYMHKRQSSVEVFNPETGLWTFLPSMKNKRSDFGYAVLDNKIYAVGGFSGDLILQSVECYDTKKQIWEPIPDMSTARSGLRCVATRGYLFVFGGFTGVSRVASVERYDPLSQTWCTMKPMKKNRSNLSAVVYRDYIIVAGGYGNGSTMDTTELYDIFEDSWYDLAPLPKSRSALNLINLEGKPELSARLLGENKETPSVAAKRRNRECPPYLNEIHPVSTPLPSSQKRNSNNAVEQLQWPLLNMPMNYLEDNWLDNVLDGNNEETEDFAMNWEDENYGSSDSGPDSIS